MKTGAYKGVKECDKTREFVKLIASKANQLNNVGVYIYPTDRNAFKDAQSGALSKVLSEKFPGVKFDYVFEIHFNAFDISAFGTECFVIPEENGIAVEQAIMKNVSKFFKLRDNDNIFDGVKRTRFLVIDTFKKMGISGALFETCFIDNESDMNTYEDKKDLIAQGIVDGIATGFGLNKKATTTTTTTSKPKVSASTSSGFKKNDKVVLSKNATVYQGASKGVKIPSSVKGKTYTIQNISSDSKQLLLKEIVSWVLASECSKKTSSSTKTNSTALKVGDTVKVKTKVDYNGIVNDPWVTEVLFEVMEIRGDRVVVGRKGAVIGAWLKSKVSKVK